MSTIIFAIVMLHLVVGFGYVLFRIMAEPKDDPSSKPKI